MTREEYAVILKRRESWRRFFPWALREDMDALLVAVLANLDAPVPEPLKDLTPELERLKSANAALTGWISSVFELNKLPIGGPIVDLITKGTLKPPKK